MSRSIYSTDDVWVETLPHIIEPQLQQKEWLLGFVLRCDKVNDWAAGTTLKLVTRHVSSMRQLGAIGSFVAAEQINIALLAQLINVSIDVVQRRRTELVWPGYTARRPQFLVAGAIPPFRVCPACLQDDIFTKWLALPLLRTCPIHKCFSGTTARGAPLQPFHSMSAPFTCGVCGRPWQELARVDADPDIVGATPSSWIATIISWSAARHHRSRRLLPSSAGRSTSGTAHRYTKKRSWVCGCLAI
jgi:hypothetical protein